ncbi:MAG: ATP-binding protein [Alteraurantiacibacter sp. bin_em_oilr2.035]|nr:ATP-binding protein [Aurantiacibacter atlanticus]MDF1834801.1 ATP-binding protein [Alteraurantiacibacter sp. bin_em_oilr2.035]
MDIITVRIGAEADVPRVRQVSDTIAQAFGLESFAKTRMITAILEITRNALQHGGGGKVHFHAKADSASSWLIVRVKDQGGGLPAEMQFVKERRPFKASRNPSSGMGLGLSGVQRLADTFDLQSSSEGTCAELGFAIAANPKTIPALVEEAGLKLGELSDTDPISELSRQNRELAEAMAERELLIDEVHHRTGNNLALIISFIQLSKRNTQLAETREAMAQLEARVHSVAKVHQELQRAHLGEKVTLIPLLENVARHAQDAFSNPELDIVISVFGDPVVVQGAAAVDLGLIVNELITNAYKHAFNGLKEGRVDVSFERSLDSKEDGPRWELKVADNGIGMPEGVKRERSNSLGWRMIRAMSARHSGEIATVGGDGFATTITFPEDFANLA